jgi:hypothetical protein
MILCGALLALAFSTAQPAHPSAFWSAVAANHYEVPAGSDVRALVDELASMLASPDPAVRDEIAYTTLAAWIYQTRVVGPTELGPLTDRLLDNLKDGIGESGNDRVFKRSFSALVLSVIVARDNAAPFLTPEAFRRIEGAAVAYLGAEQDLRGYDPEHGWMHSAAHTADLLKFVARSRFLEASEQPRLLDAIAQKLAAVPTVFTHGEDERLARAVLSIVNRSDFDRGAFAAWISRVKPPRQAARPTLAALAGSQNRKNLLAKLEVLLASDAEPSESVRSARDNVRAALKDAF